MACFTSNVDIDSSELGGIKFNLGIARDASDAVFCEELKITTLVDLRGALSVVGEVDELDELVKCLIAAGFTQFQA